MKLILKHYLSSLRERGELDAILPDLLSQMGLNVFSRPARGTRQDGVDVAAVGCLDGGPETVYLFSIKAGDLSRKDWDGDSLQSLRRSLNEILDAFVPHRLPPEHRDKPIAVCIVIGGDVQEQVRSLLTGYIEQNSTDGIRFEEWNGDKLSSNIQSSFLQEELLPEHARSLLRKSLALLDEPDVSCRSFTSLVESLSNVNDKKDSERITALRQMSICLWVLFAWARDAGNMEAAYLGCEVTLLRAWNIVRLFSEKNKTEEAAVETAFASVFSAYQQICTEFLSANVIPYAEKLHAVSSAVRTTCPADINLKLFDVLGRVATDGLWAYWGASRYDDENPEAKRAALDEATQLAMSVKSLIGNNPVLLSPLQDSQAIDISIAILLLSSDPRNRDFVRNWLSQILGRSGFSYQVNGAYPCILESYHELISHPVSNDDAYRKEVTGGSILYPTIALWSALLNDDKPYQNVAELKQNHLQHCNFQLWYPDEHAEEIFFTRDTDHGSVLCDVPVEGPKEEFLKQVFGECDQNPYFRDVSAIKFGWWPLIVVSCRHNRLPLPLHLLEGHWKRFGELGDNET